LRHLIKELFDYLSGSFVKQVNQWEKEIAAAPFCGEHQEDRHEDGEQNAGDRKNLIGIHGKFGLTPDLPGDFRRA